MPSSLFGATSPIGTTHSTVSPLQEPSTKQSDPVDIATNALTQSHGDAKKAFYALAEQKGVDPNQVLDQVRSMGDPKTMLKNILVSNPRIGGLLNLFGAIK